MAPWKGLTFVFIVSSLVVGGRAECTKAAIATCLQSLVVNGVGLSPGGAIGLLTSATPSSIQNACTSKFPMSKQCLADVVLSCVEDNILKAEANAALDYLNYICTAQGLTGLQYLTCLERQEVRVALHNCSAAFESMLNRFQGDSISDILTYILGGQGLKDFCDVITSARVCNARAVAMFCSVEASMYNDEMFQQIVNKVSEFLKCAENGMQYECPTNPCLNGGTCFGLPPDYTSCTCVTGYTGNHCQHTTGLPAVNCVSSGCQNGGICNVDTNSCMCSPGYTGNLCQNLAGTTDGQMESGSTGSGSIAFSKTEAFIAAIVCVVVLLGVILVVVYCVRVKRRNRLVETIQDAVHPQKDPGLKIPPDF